MMDEYGPPNEFKVVLNKFARKGLKKNCFKWKSRCFYM